MPVRFLPQVFSLAYGTVHEEVNSLKRGTGKSKHKMEHNLVARIAEEGVTFRSYRCALLCCAVPCCAVPCPAVPCPAVPCPAVLCPAVLCPP